MLVNTRCLVHFLAKVYLLDKSVEMHTYHSVKTVVRRLTSPDIKAGSHYERLFQRWPAFEKSNK